MNGKSGWGVLALLVGAAVMGGCATTASVGDATPAPAPAAAAVAAPPQSPALNPYKKGEAVVKADTKDNFSAIVAAINQQMQPGGRWQYLDSTERGTIDASFSDMRGLYEKFGSVSAMTSPAKVRLLADQDTVNAILTRKDGERLICRNEIPVGSHLPVRHCRTYAQMQAEQRNAQQYLRDHALTPQTATGN